MNRFCKVGDVIKSKKFIVWRPRKGNVFHLSEAPLNSYSGDNWLVVHTAVTGGGTGHGPHDVYPDGHEVTIQRLPYGQRTPDTELTLKFYQDGCFTNMIEPQDIELVKELSLKIEYSWQED
jgi:hypothetical protein